MPEPQKTSGSGIGNADGRIGKGGDKPLPYGNTTRNL